MTEELKNKIRVERAIEVIEMYRDRTHRVYDTYYKTRKELTIENIMAGTLGVSFSLKGIKEDNFKNETNKRHCLYFLIQVLHVDIETIKEFMSKEKSAEEYLLFTYRCFIEYQIRNYDTSFNYDCKDKTIDELEDYYDDVFNKRENKIVENPNTIIENSNKKKWWDIF